MIQNKRTLTHCWMTLVGLIVIAGFTAGCGADCPPVARGHARQPTRNIR